MAKRFTDTDKWKKAWFRTLSPKLKNAWIYLCDNCDHAGIWDADMGLMSFQLNEPITLAELVTAFGEKVVAFDSNKKLWVVSFFDFQYGTSKEGFRAKQSALDILRRYSLVDEFGGPVLTLSEVSTDTQTSVQDTPSKSTSNSIGKSNSESKTSAAPKNDLTLDAVNRCAEVWKATLAHFKADRAVNAQERLRIGQALQRLDEGDLLLALEGARYEQKYDGFDPAQHVNIDRVLLPNKYGKDQVGKFSTLASQHHAKVKAKTATVVEEPKEDAYTTPPQDVLERLKLNPITRGMPGVGK